MSDEPELYDVMAPVERSRALESAQITVDRLAIAPPNKSYDPDK